MSELWVHPSKLLIGDVYKGIRTTFKINGVIGTTSAMWPPQWQMHVLSIPAMDFSRWRWYAKSDHYGNFEDSRSDESEMLVIARGGVLVAILQALVPSCWNGKCHKCGKGIYTGLTAIEHEGGNCA